MILEKNGINGCSEENHGVGKPKLVWYRRRISMAESYELFWKNYFNFTGRARRKEYWYVVLINIAIYIMSWIFAFVFDEPVFYYDYIAFTPVSIIYILYAMACVIPMLSLCIRRFHDIGKSGWNVLLFFVPVISIIMLINFTSDGSRNDNEYGQSTKYFLADSEE